MVDVIGKTITGGENDGVLGIMTEEMIEQRRTQNDLRWATAAMPEEEKMVLPLADAEGEAQPEGGQEREAQLEGGQEGEAQPEGGSGLLTRLPAAVPNAEAVRQHNLTHMPYAPWCKVCIAAEAKDDLHRRLGSADGIPIVEVDYSFLAVEGSADLQPVVNAVAKESGDTRLLRWSDRRVQATL